MSDEAPGPRNAPCANFPAARFAFVLALAWCAAIVAWHWSNQYVVLKTPEGSRAAGLWTTFAALGKEFEPGEALFPFLPLAGGFAALALFGLLGRWLLLGFGVSESPAAFAALALIAGMGAAGLAWEPLGIFGGVGAPGCWAVLLAALGFAFWLARRRRGAACAPMDQAMIAPRRPESVLERAFAAAAVLAIGLITALTFYHALLYPETYWDSLILYLGYARMTFLEGAFPVKVTAQVGIGLGANYPHLFPMLGAGTAALWGHWSPIYQQLMAPILGLATVILVYRTALRLTLDANRALACALLFRAIPYGISYNIQTSDYALAMAFSAAFCLVALRYVQTREWGDLAALSLLCATAAHLNYLMLAFWGLFLLAAAAARWGNLAALARDKRFWAILGAGLALSSTWLVRNWIVAGNPVYAFFPEIFGGKNISLEALASAEREWRRNGDGIGVLTEQLYGANSLPLRLRATWFYFIQWQSQWSQFWKLAPIAAAFGLPGILFAIGRLWGWGKESAAGCAARRFAVVLLALIFGHLFYFYCLADFYLYQIIAILPALALAAAYWPLSAARWARGALGTMVLAAGFMPGIPAALMGPKLPTDDLWAFRHPLLAHQAFYRMKFGAEAEMWDYINEHLKGEKLLTHDNRHLMFDPSIQLVHLDDWDIQPLYAIESADERADALLAMNIRRYLRIPMEARSEINRRLGMDSIIAAGRASLAHGDPESGVALYTLLERGERPEANGGADGAAIR